MAIVMRAEVPGMTQALYESMIGALTPAIKAAPGFIVHAGAPIPGGWEVTEVWESHEAHDAWMKNHIMPAAKASGMSLPIITVVPAHTVITK